MIGTLLGPYRLLERIGEGGMGVVYKAQDTRLGRHVAVKLISARTTDPVMIARFLREARAVSSLNHPNVCTLYDIGEHEGVPFAVVELLSGSTLRDLLRRGPMQPERVRAIARDVAAGLAAAHRCGLIHCDIKPENIFVTTAGPAKLLDFGLACFAADLPPEDVLTADYDLTRGTIVGTLPYMSPEQLRREPLTAASDIFSLGTVLYEMLTGTHPFRRGSTIETASAILQDYTEVGPASAGLYGVVGRMLAKDPHQRYHSAEELLRELSADVSSPATAPPAADEPSVAVLPLANLSGDPQDQFFCEGVAEELINALTQLEGLRVVGRSSSFRFADRKTDLQEIGRQLRATLLLDGTLRRRGDQLRVTAQLVKVADGYQVWSERYDRRMTDLLTLEDEIASAIAERLRQRLGSRQLRESPRTRNPQAYRAYLKGRYLANRRTEGALENAVASFREAVADDETFAAAWAALGSAYFILCIYGARAPGDLIPLAREAAARALILDAKSAEARTVLGCIRAVYDWDWAGAERDLRQAVALEPRCSLARHWYAMHCLVPQRRFDEAQEQIRAAMEDDALSLPLATSEGLVHFFARRYDAAIAQMHKVVELEPGFGVAHYFLGQALAATGAIAQALTELELAVQSTGRSVETVAALACAMAQGGDADDARTLLKELSAAGTERYVSPVLLAQVQLALREPELAYRELLRARDQRALDLIWIQVRSAFDPLRPSADFAALCLDIFSPIPRER